MPDIPPNIVEPLVAIGFDSLLECEAIIHNMPDCHLIEHQEQKAYYHIADDYINMPKRKSFKSIESYYSTFFHELTLPTFLPLPVFWRKE